MVFFDNAHLKITESTFSLPEFAAMQKISLFRLFISKIHSSLECRDQSVYTHIWQCLPKKFLITF